MTTAIDVRMSESELSECIVQLGRLFGWRIAHFRPAMTKQGWRTPVAADGKGFPDLVLVRDRVVYAELKSTKGTLSNDQVDWSGSLIGAGAEYYVWRPLDWEDGTIESVLRRRTC
jgi:hypothetical protein